jgi:hypothetical protein
MRSPTVPGGKFASTGERSGGFRGGGGGSVGAGSGSLAVTGGAGGGGAAKLQAARTKPRVRAVASAGYSRRIKCAAPPSYAV